MVQKDALKDKSFAFAIRIVRLSQFMHDKHKEYVLSRQILKSGTSIGALVREAKYAHSKADFVSKLQIGLKECYETEYWIEIAKRADLISEESAKSLLHECGVIRRMLISSVNTAKENSK